MGTVLGRSALAGMFNLFGKCTNDVLSASLEDNTVLPYNAYFLAQLVALPWEMCHPVIAWKLHLESQRDPVSNDMCRVGRTHLLLLKLLRNVPSGEPERVGRDRIQVRQYGNSLKV